MLYRHEGDNSMIHTFDLFSPFEKNKWVFIANSFDYVQTFSSEIYGFLYFLLLTILKFLVKEAIKFYF